MEYNDSMKKTKLMRRLIWLDEWQWEEMESWLSAWAGKGWRVEKVGRYIAAFVKSEPAQVRYRCDVKEKGSMLECGKQHDTYLDAG